MREGRKAFGYTDFAQSLGYPGNFMNPAVQDAMNDIYDRIRKAGERVAGDFMVTDWVHAMLLNAGKELLARK